MWRYDMELPRFGIAEIFVLLHPHRHARAIVDLHRGDVFAIHLDPARGRVQRVAFRVVDKGAVPHPSAGFFRHLHPGIALFPELFERDFIRRRGPFVSCPNMGHELFAIGELRPKAQLVGETLEDLVIRAAFAHRFDDFLHRIDPVIGIGSARGDVITFQRRRRGQHDIGPPGRCCPPDIDADNRVDGFQRPDQPVGVLLVRHEVVAGVEDHVNFGINARVAVIGELHPGIFQHVGDPTGRTGAAHKVSALAQPCWRGLARLRHAAIAIVPAKADTTARPPDLPRECGEVDDGPVGHLAMLCPLQRPSASNRGG